MNVTKRTIKKSILVDLGVRMDFTTPRKKNPYTRLSVLVGCKYLDQKYPIFLQETKSFSNSKCLETSQVKSWPPKSCKGFDLLWILATIIGDKTYLVWWMSTWKPPNTCMWCICKHVQVCAYVHTSTRIHTYLHAYIPTYLSTYLHIYKPKFSLKLVRVCQIRTPHSMKNWLYMGLKKSASGIVNYVWAKVAVSVSDPFNQAWCVVCTVRIIVSIITVVCHMI